MQEVSFLDALKSRYGAADDTANYDPAAFLVGDATRARNKTWQFVGMDAVRQKQSQFDRLEQIELREMNITVAVKASEKAKGSTEGSTAKEEQEDELRKANLRRLRSLDLSANARLSLCEVATLLGYLPALQSLQLCDIPTLLPSQSAQPVLCSTQLTKLVLNHTGFRCCAQLAALVALPHLAELHLDSNELTSFDLYDTSTGTQGEVDEAGGAAMPLFPHVTTLSLAHNRLHSWGVDDVEEEKEERRCTDGSGVRRGLGHTLHAAFPALLELYLGDNALPNLFLPDALIAAEAARDTTRTSDDAAAKLPAVYGFFAQLTLLFVNDIATLTSPRTIDALRVLCPQLRTFRATYATLFPGWNETLGRMYVIAALPTLQTLNRGQIREKERLDADVFYIQRGLAHEAALKKKEEEQTSEGETNAPAYPLLARLREKHKDLVLSIYREGGSASADGTGGHMLLTVTLRCENMYNTNTSNKKEASREGQGAASCLTTVEKTLPSSMTIGKLKALVRVTFHIDPMHQALRYSSGDAAVLQTPVELDNELQTLAYYGVSNGDIITVRDISLR